MNFPLAMAVLASMLAGAPIARAKILQKWTFEEGKDALHNLRIEGDKPEVVPDPANPANKVMKAVYLPNANRSRSEVMPGLINVGQERWISARILRNSQNQGKFNCFFQIGPVDGAKGHGGRGLYQLNCYDHHEWTFRGFYERVGGKGIRQKVGSIRYGKWDRWVFHVKVGTGKDGLIKVWRNGVLVFQQAGQNAYPGDHVRIKWGVYVGQQVPKEINCFYDDVIIGDETSSREELRSAESGLPDSLPTPF